MTTTELQRFIRIKRRTHDEAGLPPYEVAFHERFAFPWTCFMVAWVGIPLGVALIGFVMYMRREHVRFPFSPEL